MKASDLKQANELASANNLTRCTQSVVRDTKRNQLIVTEEVSKGFETPDFRKEISYFFFEDVDTSNVNPLLCEAKALATFRFLGLNDKVTAKSAKAKVLNQPEGAGKDPEESSVEVDNLPEESKQKPKPKARKPRKSKSESKAVSITNVEDDIGDDDALGLDTEGEPEAPQGQLYTKGKQDHAIHLRDLIVDEFGKDWKKDQKAVLVAKGLVLKLDQKVYVVDDEGEVLESFKKEVREIMETLK